MDRNEMSKKEMFYHYLKIALAVGFVIWVIFSINGVQGTAQENNNLILKPEYETSFVPGGPERFSDAYSEIENTDTEKVEKGDYLWGTILISNRGRESGENVNINIETTAAMDQILVNPSGWSNELNIETADNKMSTDITINQINIDDTARIFVGFNKDKITISSQEWIDNYKNYLKRISIESDNGEDILYGSAY